MYKCTICDDNFSSNQTLSRHIASVHDIQKPFKCSLCDASFIQNSVLKTHVAIVHKGQKPFKCSICNASFSASYSVKTHIATVHEEQKPFKCSICDASFGRNYSLKLHFSTLHKDHIAAVHEGKKTLKYSDTSLSSKQTFEKQVESVHEGMKPLISQSNDTFIFLKCNLCHQMINKVEFVEHVKTSHIGNEMLNEIIERQKKQYEMINIHRNIAIEIYDVELRLECMLIK